MDSGPFHTILISFNIKILMKNASKMLKEGDTLPQHKFVPPPPLHNVLLLKHLNNGFLSLSLKFSRNLILTYDKTLIKHANNMFYGGGGAFYLQGKVSPGTDREELDTLQWIQVPFIEILHKSYPI